MVIATEGHKRHVVDCGKLIYGAVMNHQEKLIGREQERALAGGRGPDLLKRSFISWKSNLKFMNVFSMCQTN